jgi:hypothetical protein
MNETNKIKEDVIVLDNFELVNEMTFLSYSSNSSMYKVNRTQARLLNKKYGVDIFWCSIKRDGEEFDSYLAYFGYPSDKNFWIGNKLFKAHLEIFRELDPAYGTGVDY